MDVSIGTIWEAVARRLPGAVAISEPGGDRTYAEFEDRAARLATALERAGVGPGDTVACYLHNGAAYLETVFAAFKLGAVPVNANYRYTGEELSAVLGDADAAAIVFSGELAAHVGHAARTVPTLRLLVRAGAPADGAAGPPAAGLDDLLAATEPRPAASRPSSDRLFMYTGGTTGRPKGVIWRQGDLLHSLTVPVFRPLGVCEPPSTLDEAARIAESARARGRAPATMPVVPLMHATGLFNAMGALLTGGRVITTREGGLDARHVWETVAAQRAGRSPSPSPPPPATCRAASCRSPRPRSSRPRVPRSSPAAGRRGCSPTPARCRSATTRTRPGPRPRSASSTVSATPSRATSRRSRRTARSGSSAGAPV
ncbi:AMP-binding protein [Nonomuraea sp. KM88]|uniref:AMP-binding protein n=1 Tax=Nonomuraea sp. KM88 TaxID=3457427 RepID=UPI003FCCAD11